MQAMSEEVGLRTDAEKKCNLKHLCHLGAAYKTIGTTTYPTGFQFPSTQSSKMRLPFKHTSFNPLRHFYRTMSYGYGNGGGSYGDSYYGRTVVPLFFGHFWPLVSYLLDLSLTTCLSPSQVAAMGMEEEGDMGEDTEMEVGVGTVEIEVSPF